MVAELIEGNYVLYQGDLSSHVGISIRAMSPTVTWPRKISDNARHSTLGENAGQRSSPKARSP
ncbi:hypothetical protein DNJ95_07315 [Stutzerimonas kirkiae]|uniref:Uncharacterized protein n=1 Tax=Stutzerimonas kirkiae TaxID=2211392 RepID=A0A4Q9R6V6_9GAMM|nr:hypothetical protein DNJ96_10815 [Stutzerimonas kirkiae]TBV03394.1 hypothetical protein DNJ95_07315 [Stutzerimonas kirkiae]TBV05851.1 hypothetical protein DNK08_15235 [Stutzerimonas kirkiae]TBV12915.1 hypothetical protein DNK01_13415 [Stutzerimonas kirkiae]